MYAGRVLRACAIDGFGWFRPGDARRAFLLFDEIDCVFPDEEVGDLWYPPPVLHRAEYRARRVALNVDVDGVARTVAAACGDPAFRGLVAALPAEDLRYAVEVARTDGELRTLTLPRAQLEPTAAIAALIAKLLAYAAHTNTVPIVGKAYAYPLMRRTLELSHELSRAALDPTRPGVLASPGRKLSVAALAAGLSLEWLDAAALERLPFTALAEFKQRHARLLAQHQTHLVESVQTLSELPEGPEFASRLAELRLAAAKQRAALDEAGRTAWHTLGGQLTTQAIVAGAGAAVPVVAAIRGLGLAELVGLVVPGVVAGAGIVARSVLDKRERDRQAAPPAMAYVFEGQALLERESGGRAR